MKKYTVALAIEVDGRIYQYGSTIELDDKTAALYSHALRAVKAGEPAAVVETAIPAVEHAAAPKNAGEMIDHGSHS